MAAIAVAAIVLLALDWDEGARPEPREPPAAGSGPRGREAASASAETVDHGGRSDARAAWAAKVERVRAARRARADAETEDDETADDVQRCERDCWGTLGMQIELARATEGCRELLPEGATGRARFEASVVAEPGVGSVVASVRTVESTFTSADFVECMVESAPLAELADPEAPVSDTFVFRYSAGPRTDAGTEFVAAHPDIVDAHPELSRFLSRDPDEPVHDDDATAFARVVSSNDDVRASFMRWMTEQGVDLANVRTEP